MNVPSNLPFKFCDKCTHQDLDLKHNTYFADDLVVFRDVYLVCQNSEVCKYIVEKMKEDGVAELFDGD